MAGYTYNYGAGGQDFYLVRTNIYGDTVWTHAFGGTGDDATRSFRETYDDGFVIVGTTKSFGAGDYDVYVVKTDAVGNLAWSRTYGGSGSDIGYFAQQTTDGGYIIVGVPQ